MTQINANDDGVNQSPIHFAPLQIVRCAACHCEKGEIVVRLGKGVLCLLRHKNKLEMYVTQSATVAGVEPCDDSSSLGFRRPSCFPSVLDFTFPWWPVRWRLLCRSLARRNVCPISRGGWGRGRLRCRFLSRRTHCLLRTSRMLRYGRSCIFPSVAMWFVCICRMHSAVRRCVLSRCILRNPSVRAPMLSMRRAMWLCRSRGERVW